MELTEFTLTYLKKKEIESVVQISDAHKCVNTCIKSAFTSKGLCSGQIRFAANSYSNYL